MEAPQNCLSVNTYRESCDSYLMHGIIHALENNEHAIESLLQLLGATAAVTEAQQILQKQLVLGNPLNWLQQVRSQGKFVTQFLLAFLQEEMCVDECLPQSLRSRYILTIKRVQPVEGVTLKS